MELEWKTLGKWGITLTLAFAAALLLSELLVWFSGKVIPVFTYFLVAFIIVYAFSPLVKIMVDRKFPPVLAALLSFLVVILFFGLLFYLIIPGMVTEMEDLVNYLSREFVPFFTGLLEDLEEVDRRFELGLVEPVTEYFTEFVEDLPANLQRILQQFTTFAVDFVSRIWAVVVVTFIVFYLLIEQEKVRDQFTLMFPQVYRKDVSYIIGTIDEKVGAFIRGTALRCVIVGVLVGTVMYWLGMPFALMLGILAGILDIIVYIGPFLAAVPALLFSLMPDTPHFLVIIIIYVLVQFLESMVLTPLLMGRAVNLSPLTVIAAILIGAQAAGLLGIIISIPLAAILKVFIHHYYLARHEEEKSSVTES